MEERDLDDFQYRRVSGIWCRTPIFGLRKPRVEGHWVYAWSVHDLDATYPDQPIAVGRFNSKLHEDAWITVDERVFAEYLHELDARGDDLFALLLAG